MVFFFSISFIHQNQLVLAMEEKVEREPAKSRIQEFKVGKIPQGKSRMDAYLSHLFAKIQKKGYSVEVVPSRTNVKKIFTDESISVLLNGKKASATDRVVPGNIIVINWGTFGTVEQNISTSEANLEPENSPVILFEDDQILVVWKPANTLYTSESKG